MKTEDELIDIMLAQAQAGTEEREEDEEIDPKLKEQLLYVACQINTWNKDVREVYARASQMLHMLDNACRAHTASANMPMGASVIQKLNATLSDLLKGA